MTQESPFSSTARRNWTGAQRTGSDDEIPPGAPVTMAIRPDAAARRPERQPAAAACFRKLRLGIRFIYGTCLRSLAKIRIAHHGALAVIRDGSRMPLARNIDVRHGRSSKSVQIDQPVEPAEVLRLVLTGRDAGISLPMSQRGFEMAHRGGAAFRFAVAVEQREVARREYLLGIVFGEIGHGVCIAEGEAQFLTSSTRRCAAAAFLCSSAATSSGVIPLIFSPLANRVLHWRTFRMPLPGIVWPCMKSATVKKPAPCPLWMLPSGNHLKSRSRQKKRVICGMVFEAAAMASYILPAGAPGKSAARNLPKKAVGKK